MRAAIWFFIIYSIAIIVLFPRTTIMISIEHTTKKASSRLIMTTRCNGDFDIIFN